MTYLTLLPKILVHYYLSTSYHNIGIFIHHTWNWIFIPNHDIGTFTCSYLPLLKILADLFHTDEVGIFEVDIFCHPTHTFGIFTHHTTSTTLYVTWHLTCFGWHFLVPLYIMLYKKTTNINNTVKHYKLTPAVFYKVKHMYMFKCLIQYILYMINQQTGEACQLFAMAKSTHL